jgi:hypothetical protein
MKNINYLTFDELVKYLDLTATDPVVRKLIGMLLSNGSNIIQELINEGMGLDGYFSEDYESHTPAEYIKHLRSEIEDYESLASDRQYDLERAEARIEALEEKIKVWTIMESK